MGHNLSGLLHVMKVTPRTAAIGTRQVNRIGLGTNRLNDTPEHRHFLEAAVDAGVNHIDSAHLYAGGESEATIGNALAPFGPDLTVATKGHFTGGGPDGLREQLETSLQRLRTDSIALYYVHRFHPEFSIEDTLAPLAEAREAGTVENIGISEVTIEQIERARAVVPIAVVQNEYSLGERMHDEVIDFCEREGIAFVPFFPLRGSGRRLRRIAKSHGATERQVMLAWLLHRSPAVAPIPGTRSIEHLRSNLAALDLDLSDEDVAQLNGA
jgi:pyridoxine 4-dehydrogenase